jgi:diguanylate cyclase
MLSRLRLRRSGALHDPSTPAPPDHGAAVLAWLQARAIPSDPRYYALVHTALSDRHSLAAHALSEAEIGGTALDHDGVDRLLEAIAGRVPSLDRMAEESDRLHYQSLHLADLAANAAAATSQFGRDLSAGIDDIENANQSVTAVITAMVQRTRTSERQLAAAVEQIEQLRDEVAEARNDAMRDELTGLLNRRGVLDHLASLDARPRTLAVCDIDAFKAINDGHGHEVGDRVLKVVAAALADGCSPHLVGRWGGEEFLVLLDEADPAIAAEIIDGVREELSYRSLKVRETGAALGTITFSAGVAEYAAGFDPALRMADALLYQAKVAGRNRVIADPPAAQAA